MTPPNSKRPVTIYSVAKHAGVSIATVSRVLRGSTPTSPEMQAKVHKAVKELGYVPLRWGGEVTLRLETHALVLPSFSGPYYSEFIAGYEAVAGELGLSVVMLASDTTQGVDERLHDLARRVDGLAISLSSVSNQTIESLAQKLPVVLLGHTSLSRCDALQVSNLEPTVELVSHVINHGRSHLRFLGNPTGSPDVEGRYAGFLQALSQAELPLEGPPISVPLVEEAGNEAVRLLESVASADALICANDELALAVTKSLSLKGISVPGDMVVTGWDDIMPSRYVIPGLTTVHQPIQDLGRLSATRLHDRINGADVVPSTELMSSVVIRGTCGCVESG